MGDEGDTLIFGVPFYYFGIRFALLVKQKSENIEFTLTGEIILNPTTTYCWFHVNTTYILPVSVVGNLHCFVIQNFWQFCNFVIIICTALVLLKDNWCTIGIHMIIFRRNVWVKSATMLS